MKKYLWITATLLMAAAVLAAEPEIKGAAQELSESLKSVPGRVVLTGEGEVKAPADRALISLRVVTENKSLQEASRANQEVRAKMIKSLAEHGLPSERVQPSKFSSTPKYGLFGDKAKSYRVDNVVKITAQDEKEFQAVATLVDATPAIRYDSVEFNHSDKEGLKRMALSQAINKAKDKARTFEEQLGVTLTPKSFGEGLQRPEAQPMLRRDYMKSVGDSQGTPARGSSPITQPETQPEELPTSFAELVYRAQVTVEFAVEAKK